MFRLKIIVLAFLLYSCKDQKVVIPDNVLSQDQMVEVIKDIQLLEAVHKDMGLFGMQKKHVTDTSYVIVFNKYNIKPSDFDSSYHFYTLHPKLFTEIMERVEADLNH